MSLSDELRAEFAENVTKESVDVRVAEIKGSDVKLLHDWMVAEGMDLAELREIDLGNNAIETCEELGELMRAAPNVRDIDLRENKIGKEGVYALQRPLLGLKHLTVLSLSGCSLWDYGAEVVFNAAGSMKALRALHVVDNFFTDKAAVHIAKFIAKNTPLEKLHIDYNKLRNDGANEVGRSLAKNTNLKVLGINDNCIECEGCDGFREAFAANTGGLRVIDLSVNNIGAQGAILLSKGLLQNTHLLEMDMGANAELGDAGAIALTAALRSNKALRKLDLTNNHLSDGCVDHMVESMRNNKTIEDVILMINDDMSMEGKTRIVEIAFANKTRNTEAREVEAAAAAAAAADGGLASLLKNPFLLLAILAVVAAATYSHLAAGGELPF